MSFDLEDSKFSSKDIHLDTYFFNMTELYRAMYQVSWEWKAEKKI